MSKLIYHFLFLQILFFSTFTYGNITLNSGDLSIELSEHNNWTVNNLEKNGRVYISEWSQSAQGTVLLIDGVWSGSGHGNETVVHIDLFVDGDKQEVVSGNSYEGDLIEFIRTTEMGGAYRLVSRMLITPESIFESIILDGLDPSKHCDIFYGFAGSRYNGMRHYALYDVNSMLLGDGINNQNNYNMIECPENVVSVAQFHSYQGYGILTTLSNPYGMGFNTIIWDRPYDNKLYFRFTEAEGLAYTTNHFELGQMINFFEADEETWQAVSCAMVQESLYHYTGTISSIQAAFSDPNENADMLEVIVRNLGNLEDTYILDVNDNAGWLGNYDNTKESGSLDYINFEIPISVAADANLYDSSLIKIELQSTGKGIGEPLQSEYFRLYYNHDSDQDGLFRYFDNCPNVPNVDQRDHDADFVGDLCDCLPDLDNNGNVDFKDYTILIKNWQREDCTEPIVCDAADMDYSGMVDVNDLKMIIETWLN